MKKAAVKALPSIQQAGLDIIVDPNDDKNCVILEINATAEISFHLFPIANKVQNIPAAIIDYYFPETKREKKTIFYYDYNSVIEPLKTWAVDEVEVAQPLKGKLYGRKFIVEGKIIKVGYMNWIRKQALRRGIYGKIKQVGKNKIEIIIVGINIAEIDKFIKLCKKGPSRARVKNVIEKEYPIVSPFKMGFEIVPKDNK